MHITGIIREIPGVIKKITTAFHYISKEPNLKTGETDEKAGKPGFVNGLAFTENTLMVTGGVFYSYGR